MGILLMTFFRKMWGNIYKVWIVIILSRLNFVCLGHYWYD